MNLGEFQLIFLIVVEDNCTTRPNQKVSRHLQTCLTALLINVVHDRSPVFRTFHELLSVNNNNTPRHKQPDQQLLAASWSRSSYFILLLPEVRMGEKH
eukprot:676261-Hanusia_phi.AAC.2